MIYIYKIISHLLISTSHQYISATVQGELFEQFSLRTVCSQWVLSSQFSVLKFSFFIIKKLQLQLNFLQQKRETVHTLFLSSSLFFLRSDEQKKSARLDDHRKTLRRSFQHTNSALWCTIGTYTLRWRCDRSGGGAFIALAGSFCHNNFLRWDERTDQA